MSINILPKKKQQSIDGLSSQISNIFLLLATFATKYVIMLNPKILDWDKHHIPWSICQYRSNFNSCTTKSKMCIQLYLIRIPEIKD